MVRYIAKNKHNKITRMKKADQKKRRAFFIKEGLMKPAPQLWLTQENFNRVRPGLIKKGFEVVLAMDLPSKIKKFERKRVKSDYTAVLNVNEKDRIMLIFNKDFDTKNSIVLQDVLLPSRSAKIYVSEAIIILTFCAILAYSYSINMLRLTERAIKKLNNILDDKLQVKEDNKIETLLKELRIKKDELKKIVLDQLQLFLEKTESNRDYPIPMDLIRMGRIVATREEAFVGMIKRQAKRRCKNVIADIGCFKSAFLHTLMEKHWNVLRKSYLVGLDIGGTSQPSWELYRELTNFDEIRKIMQKTGIFRPGAEQWFRYAKIKRLPKEFGNHLYVNKKYPNILVIWGGTGMGDTGPGDYRNIGRIFSDEVLKNRFGLVAYRRMFKHEHSMRGNPLEFLENYSNAFYICSEIYEGDLGRFRKGIVNARRVLKSWRTKEWREKHSYFLFAERKRG